jgi:hypothetical protein
MLHKKGRFPQVICMCLKQPVDKGLGAHKRLGLKPHQAAKSQKLSSPKLPKVQGPSDRCRAEGEIPVRTAEIILVARLSFRRRGIDLLGGSPCVGEKITEAN